MGRLLALPWSASILSDAGVKVKLCVDLVRFLSCAKTVEQWNTRTYGDLLIDIFATRVTHNISAAWRDQIASPRLSYYPTLPHPTPPTIKAAQYLTL